MRRRQPDERPPIEVVGAEPGLTSLQHVSTGPPGGGGRGRRGLVVGACVVALVVLGLALGNDDRPPEDGAGEPAAAAEERTTTTRRPGPSTTRPRITTTTTTTLPTGPVFGEPVGGSLLVFAGSTWTHVDVDTGARRELELAGRDVYETRVVRGGVVSLSSDREARYFRLGAGVDALPVSLGAADQVLSHPETDRVWLLDFGDRELEAPSSEQAEARLVDLEGNVLQTLSVTGYVSAATEDGLLFERGGRVFVVDASGVRPFAVGFVIGAVDRSALLYTCDDAAQCRLELRPPSGGARRLLDSPPESFDFGHEVAPRPSGGFALVRYGGNSGDGSIAFYDAEGRSLGSLVQPAESYFGRPYWLPGEAGLVAADGGRPTRIRQQDGEWVREEIESLRDLPAEAIYVIEP